MVKCPTVCPECGAQLGGKKGSKKEVIPDIPPDTTVDSIALPPVRKRHKKKLQRKVGPDLGKHPIYGSLKWM